LQIQQPEIINGNEDEQSKEKPLPVSIAWFLMLFGVQFWV